MQSTKRLIYFFPPMELLSQLWGRTFISRPLQMDHVLKFNCFVTLAARTLCIPKTNYSWCTVWLWHTPTSDWLSSLCKSGWLFSQSSDIMFREKKTCHSPGPKQKQKINKKWSIYSNSSLKTKLAVSVLPHSFSPNLLLHSFVTTDFPSTQIRHSYIREELVTVKL